MNGNGSEELQSLKKMLYSRTKHMLVNGLIGAREFVKQLEARVRRADKVITFLMRALDVDEIKFPLDELKAAAKEENQFWQWKLDEDTLELTVYRISHDVVAEERRKREADESGPTILTPEDF